MISLYRATGGPNWTEDVNWLSDRPMGEWHGVTTNDQGRVTGLILRNNGLTGEIPPDLGRLSELEMLFLLKNRLSGEIPRELTELSKLQVLLLHENQLSGTIPPGIGEMSTLTHLRLNQNRLSGNMPTELASLTQLVVLDLMDNDLTGEIPPGLGGFTDLEYLDLSRNRFTGQIPPEFGHMSALTHLLMNQNRLSGEIPKELGDHSILKILRLDSNQLSGAIPKELGNLSNLENLRLDSNQLSGVIPKELGNLSNLENLRLDSNQLSGVMPPELGRLSNLTGFEILENQLSGEVPAELADLKKLSTLFLSRNPALTGCMPDDLLDIENNDFEHVDLQPCEAFERNVLSELFVATDGDNWTRSDGWLSNAPVEQWHGVSTDRYGRIDSLDLTDNGLSGEIPTVLRGLTRLREVRFGENQIAGCIPLALLAVPDNDLGFLGVPECGVYIPDYYLRMVLMDALGKDSDAEIYADDLKSLTELNLRPNFIRDLEGLQHAENLVSLTLGVSSPPPGPDEEGFPNRIHDLSPLSGLTGLVVLNIARAQAANLSPLEGLTRLEHLDIGYNGVKDLSPISDLPRLETLIAPGNNIDDLANLDGASNLRGLNLAENLITDVSPLVGLTNLERLNVSHNLIEDWTALTGLAALERLEIKNVGIVEIPPLDGLNRLKLLDIGWNELADLSPLSALSGLETLIAGPADLGDAEGIPLPGSLRHLHLAGGNISDLSLVRGLRDLQTLVVSNNLIADLSAVSMMDDLEILDVGFNQVEDLTPLSGLANLRKVVVIGNPVSGVGPLAANAGFGAGSRLEVDEELYERASSTGDVNALESRGVELAVREIELTAYSEPMIFSENVFVLPVPEGLPSFNLSLQEIVKSFYVKMADVFDFVMIVSNLQPKEDRLRTYTGRYVGVSNDTEGIGFETFVDEEWGSGGKLQGVLHFPANDAIRRGPVLHELMHRWGNHVIEPFGHWGFSSVNGTVGGFDIANLKDLGGGRYTAGGFGPGGIGWNGIPYPMLELYLAGLATPDEVPDWVVGVDGDFARDAQGMIERYDDGEVIFTAKELKPFSIDYIIDRHGPRVPDFESSQKEFRAAVILLIDEEHPATTEVLTTLSDYVEKFSYLGDDGDDEYFNFFEATLGRAQMLMGGLSEFRLETASN